ncbi:hypothetical protein KTD22_17695 [Burkholderia multivorans]|uniref:hypothetical protein n=2 Tax=Burkholderia multivorans TaxID=87883 RepID=UPI001C238F46|nr:hypothetical protein [Burkholderia multivorans]MBU9228461.1 hypothetical protein [Burkholderia multivorans]
MEKSPVKPKALESRFGVGGSTRSLLAASEQDFGGTKQNLRGSRRFGPIFMSRGRIAVLQWPGGRRARRGVYPFVARPCADDKRVVLSVIPCYDGGLN